MARATASRPGRSSRSASVAGLRVVGDGLVDLAPPGRDLAEADRHERPQPGEAARARSRRRGPRPAAACRSPGRAGRCRSSPARRSAWRWPRRRWSPRPWRRRRPGGPVGPCGCRCRGRTGRSPRGTGPARPGWPARWAGPRRSPTTWPRRRCRPPTTRGGRAAAGPAPRPRGRRRRVNSSRAPSVSARVGSIGLRWRCSMVATSRAASGQSDRSSAAQLVAQVVEVVGVVGHAGAPVPPCSSASAVEARSVCRPDDRAEPILASRSPSTPGGSSNWHLVGRTTRPPSRTIALLPYVVCATMRHADAVDEPITARAIRSAGVGACSVRGRGPAPILRPGRAGRRRPRGGDRAALARLLTIVEHGRRRGRRRRPG